MPETLDKLRPDRDLQCYFEKPSAIAAVSEASAAGFTLSGCWRQQFDWSVIEWNRDNVFEHPLFRNLPDGDLSGLRLTYEDTRENCIPLDSTLFPTVDWPYLRVWADDNGEEKFYRVRISDYATPVAGEYQSAWAEFELTGTPAAGAFIGIAWPGEHHTYQLYWNDTLETALQAVADSVNTFSITLKAVREDSKIRLFFVGQADIATSRTGHNGNRFGAYAYTSGSDSLQRSEWWRPFDGGVSPSRWRVDLDFAQLTDIDGRPVPTQSVRKLRWTYAADYQNRAYERSEFKAVVSNWNVTGTNRAYRVAGSDSKRFEDGDPCANYTGTWSAGSGNFSGGSIHYSQSPGASILWNYTFAKNHCLHLGTRLTPAGARVAVIIDDGVETEIPLQRAGEDVLVRIPLGNLPAGSHRVEVIHRGESGSALYIDFLECAIPRTELPELPSHGALTLATDWDTDHSLALPAERTAWMIRSLGFRGRVNHYVGAMWFYELARRSHAYASATIQFSGSPTPSELTQITVGRSDRSPAEAVTLTHLNHIGDTAETIARLFEIEINSGYTGIRAEASGSQLTIQSRSMGNDGNAITISACPETGSFTATLSSGNLSGGVDGEWTTDVSALPRLNRAARDWHRTFFKALGDGGLNAVAAFSMELQHGDARADAGIAQRYPDGSACLLNTPALQTNFSPASRIFYRDVYRGMAELMESAGLAPYLQFGEVQWWYFASNGTGMPFYDAYTRERFSERYGREMAVIPNHLVATDPYAAEVELLPKLIGEFTDDVSGYVRLAFPACRFEVLYPTDVNESALNRAVNYPVDSWTPDKLECLKTESFGFTAGRDLNKCRASMKFGEHLGFAGRRKSHLVGISDPETAWLKEAQLAAGAGLESVVLFALDQFCLVGYRLPLKRLSRRSVLLGR